MNRLEFFKRWADVLESGEYAQGRQVLRTVDNKYCCLGVACDIAIKEDLSLGEWEKSDSMVGDKEVWLFKENNFYSRTILPHPIRVFLEVDSEVVLPTSIDATREFLTSKGLGKGIVWLDIEADKMVLLTVLNDNGASFTDIAALIREFLIKPLEEERHEQTDLS